MKKAKQIFTERPELTVQVAEELNAIEKSGRFPEIWFLKEIAECSVNEGYPVMPFGRESSLISFFLMGISNIDPKLYDFSTIPSRAFLETTEKLEKMPFGFVTGVSITVLKKIECLLNEKFRDIESGSRAVTYKLIESETLEKIGRLSKETAIDYNGIDYLERRICEHVFDELFFKNFGDIDVTQRCFGLNDVAKQFAFSVCSSKQEKDFDLFLYTEDYLFIDNIIEGLIKLGETDDAAVNKARIINPAIKDNLISFLSEKGSETYSFVEACKRLDYVWSRTACLARTIPLLMLKYYEIDYIDRIKKETE